MRSINGVINSSLYFQLAYNLFTNPINSPNYSDTLTVLLSTDCGVTWIEIYKKLALKFAYPANNKYPIEKQLTHKPKANTCY